jgi:AraC-like DNA-binding protein
MESKEPVERAVRQMHDHFAEEICIEALAADADMSPFHFLRTFRRFTGVTPALFLSALRLQEAKRLLLTTDRSVTDICFDVGYNSLGTFTTRFTQQVGVSPARLRRLGSGFRLEALALAAERLAPGRPPAGATTVTGTVEAGAPHPAILFLGLFERPIPQQRPLACAILPTPGPFRLNAPGTGRCFLFAAGLSFSADPLDFLLSNRAIDQVAASGCLTLRSHDGPPPPIHLRLRPLTALDPPLLVALPLLLAERRARATLREPAEVIRSVSTH